MLSAAACKPNSTHVLCEMPGSMDLHGDMGAVGRMCMAQFQDASDNHADDAHATVQKAHERLHMDIKGDLLACWCLPKACTVDTSPPRFVPRACLSLMLGI